jgi:hypothetical protein
MELQELLVLMVQAEVVVLRERLVHKVHPALMVHLEQAVLLV